MTVYCEFAALTTLYYAAGGALQTMKSRVIHQHETLVRVAGLWQLSCNIAHMQQRHWTYTTKSGLVSFANANWH